MRSLHDTYVDAPKLWTLGGQFGIDLEAMLARMRGTTPGPVTIWRRTDHGVRALRG